MVSTKNNFGEKLPASFVTVNKPALGLDSGIQVDCSSFPAGIYLLEARNDHDVSRQKFVVERQ